MANKRKRGQPTKLDSALENRIVEAVRAGYYLSTAARFVGVSDRSLYSWMKKGRERNTALHEQFFQAVKKAQADFELLAVSDIRQIAMGKKKGSWQALAWLLERTIPERYSLSDVVRSEDAEAEEGARRPIVGFNLPAGTAILDGDDDDDEPEPNH